MSESSCDTYMRNLEDSMAYNQHAIKVPKFAQLYGHLF